MDIEKLIDRLLEWGGVDAVDNGEFTEVNYHGVFELLREAADALEQLQAENDRLRRERDDAIRQLKFLHHVLAVSGTEELRDARTNLVATQTTITMSLQQRRNKHGTVD